MTFFSICLSVSLAGALGPILSPVTGVIAHEFNVSISKAALPAGYPLLTAGCGAFIAQAWAPILGKRSAYIVSTMILFASTIWNSHASSFESLLACRTFQGFGNGAYESIAISSIRDLFFVGINSQLVFRTHPVDTVVLQVHERGKRIVFYNIVTLGCANITPILGSYISNKHGWSMQFKILIGFTGLALLVILFACPEHAHIRPIIYETDMRSTMDLTGAQEEKARVTTSSQQLSTSVSENSKKPKTYWQELKPFDGSLTRQNPLILLARSFVCFLYPAVFWGFTVGGLWSSWTIGLSIVVAQIFGAPPNLFDPTKLGLLSSSRLSSCFLDAC